MLTHPPNVYRQAIVVLGQNTNTDQEPSAEIALTGVVPNYISLSAQTIAPKMSTLVAETRIFQLTLSSVPVIREAELEREYQELGQALSELTELQHEAEWQIEPSVYTAACNVAVALNAIGIPAPRVFNHGSKSVVFNWSNKSDNLYLTISANHISALISSPDRIKRRLEYPVNQLADPQRALAEISAAFTKKPVKRLITGTVSHPIERVE